MGQMLHDSCKPLVETSLAKHGFPPLWCGFCNFPQYAARREAMSLFKKPPLMSRGGWGALGHPREKSPGNRAYCALATLSTAALATDISPQEKWPTPAFVHSGNGRPSAAGTLSASLAADCRNRG